MNFSRLQQTRIPDLAPIYGGARGRTMSSRHQAYAWWALKEAGVKNIIDLRLTDYTDRLPALCEEYGMQYFHYPVDTSVEAIAQMVDLFTRFCQHIDEGDFYIACAMGLHRTDIALSAYWIFHGADKGLEPPCICGYRQKDGHSLDKLNRVLNALYAELAEYSVPKSIPASLFKARKSVIVKQSQQ